MREMSSHSAATRRRFGEETESWTSAKRTRGVFAEEGTVWEGVIEEGSCPGGGDERDGAVPAASAATLAAVGASSLAMEAWRNESTRRKGMTNASWRDLKPDGQAQNNGGSDDAPQRWQSPPAPALRRGIHQGPFEECWAERAESEGHSGERVGMASEGRAGGNVLLVNHGGAGSALVEIFATQSTVNSTM